MILILSLALGLTIVSSVALILWLVIQHLQRGLAVDELHRQQIAELLAMQEREHEAHRREVAELTNKLQHPEIVFHTPDPSVPDEELPLSDEEMAERELYLERVEQLERQGVIS